MTGKCYYMTTLSDWKRHAPRFAASHFVVLASPSDSLPLAASVAVGDAAPGGAACVSPSCADKRSSANEPCKTPSLEQSGSDFVPSDTVQHAAGEDSLDAATKILVLVEADEGVHLSLEDEPAFEALPHPLAQKPISDAAQSALAPHGVAPGATTFDMAEAVARVHPLLRHRVF